MAPLVYLGCRKVLLFSLPLLLFVSVCFSTSLSAGPLETKGLCSSTSTSSSRRLLKLDAEEQQLQEKPFKKITTTKNHTSLIKPSKNFSLKNQTKTIKTNNLSTKNQTKLAKVSSNSTSKTIPTTTTLADTGLKKKLNSTIFKTKKLNSTSKTSPNVPSSKKSVDLEKAITANPKNKTTKATANYKDQDNKQTKTKVKVDEIESENKKASPTQESKKSKKQATPYWMDEKDDDLVSEFKDLPNRFQQTLIPDLERISTTSRAYITKANKEITKGFKPYVGNKYAPTIATLLSCAFALIPLLLVSLLFNKIKAYFSLHKLLIFIQVYLSIYFSILCLSSLVTGLEPLRFFYSTSQSTYLCLQVLQTLAYVLYLLLLLMYLVLVFSTDCGLGSKFLGLAQTLVSFAVGLHYYMTVFHRIVLRQPPKTNWKVHGIYATCFLLICLLASADRRKKTYLEEGGEEGKKN